MMNIEQMIELFWLRKIKKKYKSNNIYTKKKLECYEFYKYIYNANK